MIASVAAGAQRNEVTFGRLFELLKSDGIVNRKVPSLNVQSTSINAKADPVWITSVASDLANAILNQTTGSAFIGNEGYWNDTILPRAFYLDSYTWDMIEPDVLAGIDGM